MCDEYSVCDAVDKKLWNSFDDEMLRSATKNNERDTKNSNSNFMLAKNFKQKLHVRLNYKQYIFLRNFYQKQIN